MTVSNSTPPTGADLRAALERDGFVVIKAILDPPTLASLRDVSAHATALGRAGSWPHVRVHLMNPALPGSPAFTRLYFSDAVLGPVKHLLRCTDDDLVMELFNMLVRPERDFELRWHRDDIPRRQPRRGARQARRTGLARAVQLGLRNAGPYETGLEGELRVRLEPGDIVFYDNNILHRGAYDSTKERMTLHGSVGHTNGGALRARNVLQHAIGAAEGMRARLVKLGQEVEGKDLGYSQQG
ncbi:unnamed protein product [Parascedosporium putredinis]|uniref:Phytanoyl-CoA dioxygenase n=1 Tax=Parascedosporium putredinis TaxID=1442378 RepID=A0A9P1HD77_9PEZI|nr:unnamed protein product [Parascedosporium putredinis]CAI8004573.1 unnamed protein product [Parascedosporium putredinis]